MLLIFTLLQSLNSFSPPSLWGWCQTIPHSSLANAVTIASLPTNGKPPSTDDDALSVPTKANSCNIEMQFSLQLNSMLFHVITTTLAFVNYFCLFTVVTLYSFLCCAILSQNALSVIIKRINYDPILYVFWWIYHVWTDSTLNKAYFSCTSKSKLNE